MNRPNTFCAKDEERPLRITRARARALRGIPPCSRPSFKNERKNVLRASSKRAASENKTCMIMPDMVQHKRKAVLTDVTNIGTKPRDKRVKASQFQVSVKHSFCHQM